MLFLALLTLLCAVAQCQIVPYSQFRNVFHIYYYSYVANTDCSILPSDSATYDNLKCEQTIGVNGTVYYFTYECLYGIDGDNYSTTATQGTFFEFFLFVRSESHP
jgi:hypothetical protein